MKFTLYFHCTVEPPLAFWENLSPRGTTPKTAIWWHFPITDKANEIISLTISSDELTDLRLLVPVSIVTRSAFL